MLIVSFFFYFFLFFFSANEPLERQKHKQIQQKEILNMDTKLLKKKKKFPINNLSENAHRQRLYFKVPLREFFSRAEHVISVHVQNHFYAVYIKCFF